MVAIVGALALALAAPAGARAQGVDQTCELSATRFDPDTVNVLFPDQSAQYWSADYVGVPGTRIRIDGVFPYSRYTSWNVYDSVLRPFAKLSDFQLVPDAGSANPFQEIASIHASPQPGRSNYENCSRPLGCKSVPQRNCNAAIGSYSIAAHNHAIPS